MKKICVYTCITGEYDDLKEIDNLEENVDYYCFTNNKSLKSKTWKIVYIEDEKLDNHLLSRKIKILGHPLINNKYDIFVWQDASVHFVKSIKKFVLEYYDEKKASFSSFKHSERNCIYDEAVACYKFFKDTKESIKNTVDFLEKEHYPHNNGLYEMTVFIINRQDKVVNKTMEDWFKMLTNYSKRDQLSFMYCVWKNKMKINTINLKVFDNDWFTWEHHNKKRKLDKYSVYFGNDSDYNINNDIHGTYIIKNNHYMIDIKSPIETDKFEVNLFTVPCTLMKNIKYSFKDKYKVNYEFVNKKGKELLFYNYDGKIIINKKVKKGEIIKIDMELYLYNSDEIDDYINDISMNNIKLDSTNEYLTVSNESLQKELSKILNSKAWKFIQIIRKILLFWKRK